MSTVCIFSNDSKRSGGTMLFSISAVSAAVNAECLLIGISAPLTRNIGGPPAKRWRSDPPCATTKSSSSPRRLSAAMTLVRLLHRRSARFDRAQGLGEYFRRDGRRFDDVPVGRELLCPFNIRILALIADNNDLRALREMLLSYCLERPETANAWHDEVEKNSVRRFSAGGGRIFPKCGQEIFAIAEYTHLMSGIPELYRIQIEKESIIINDIDAISHC